MRPGQKVYNLPMFPVHRVIGTHLSELKGHVNLCLSAFWHREDIVNLEHLMLNTPLLFICFLLCLIFLLANWCQETWISKSKALI